MSDELDPDDRARINAYLDQAHRGWQEPEVREAVFSWYEDCNLLADVLLSHMPENSVAPALGGLFATWLLDEFESE